MTMEHGALDRVLYKLGWRGRYQVTQLILIYISVFPGSLNILSYIFVGYIDQHQCSEVGNTSVLGVHNDVNTSLHYGECSISVSSNPNITSDTFPCVAGNTYTEHKHVSIVSEWDLVCERASMSELTQTVFVVGQAIGGLLCSSMSDRFGRRLTYIFNLFLLLVVGFGLSFSPNYATFVTFRFIAGIGQQGVDLTIAIMILESVPTEKRFIVGMFGSMLWGASLVTLAPLAYLLRDYSWRYLQLAVTLTAAYSLILPFTLNESLRWLEANGKVKEINRILRKAAKMNKVDEEEVLKTYHGYYTQKANGEEVADMSEFQRNIIIGNGHTPTAPMLRDTIKDDHRSSSHEVMLNSLEKKQNTSFLPITVLDEHGNIILSQDDNTFTISNADGQDSLKTEKSDDIGREPQGNHLGMVEGSKDTDDPTSGTKINDDIPKKDDEEVMDRASGSPDEDCSAKTELLPVANGLHMAGQVTGTKRYTLLDILKNKIIFYNALIVWYCWIVDSIVYYGLYMTEATLAGNRYLNYFLNSVVEVPASFLIYLTLERFGRRRPSLLFHSTAGLCLFSATLLRTFAGEVQAAQIGATILNLIGKLTITTAFGTLFIYTPELFPTNLRNAGIGAASCASRLGGMLAPFSSTLEKLVAWAPGAVFAVICLLAGFLIQFLPETRGHELPQTMEEIKAWYKEHRSGGKNKEEGQGKEREKHSKETMNGGVTA